MDSYESQWTPIIPHDFPRQSWNSLEHGHFRVSPRKIQFSWEPQTLIQSCLITPLQIFFDASYALHLHDSWPQSSVHLPLCRPDHERARTGHGVGALLCKPCFSWRGIHWYPRSGPLTAPSMTGRPVSIFSMPRAASPSCALGSLGAGGARSITIQSIY